MRLPLVGLVATLAATAILGLGPDRAPAIAVARGATPRPAAYLYHLQFSLLYEIQWSHKSGLEGAAQDPCASWQSDRGSTTVIAHDAPWRRKGEKKARRHGIPGSITFLGTGPSPKWAPGQWASGTAVGPAEAIVRRRWRQVGGPSAGDIEMACPDRKGAITPWIPTTKDCGTRRFTTKTATFAPQRREKWVTLSDLMTIPGTPKSKDDEAFAITVGPGRELYKNCRTYDPAPYPLNLGVHIKIADLADLKDLPAGERVEADWTQAGRCDDDLPAIECSFKIDLEWTIERVPDGKIVFP
jgi:hypothetical protein